jgi:hypothetical protein
MHRGVHISISLLAVLLLLRPFDCFASAAPAHRVSDCCLKGKCDPVAKAAECCRNGVPGGGQLVLTNTAAKSTPIAAVAANHPSILVPGKTIERRADPLRHPPPPSSLTARNLPLLI